MPSEPLAKGRPGGPSLTAAEGTWDHRDTLTAMSVAIAIIVPIVSALIAGYVAWVVANRQALKAREQWILDKRHAAYERVVTAVIDMLAVVSLAGGPVRHATTSRLLADPVTRQPLLAPMTGLELVAPGRIRNQTKEVVKMMWDTADDETNAERFWEQAQGLVNLLREDLVPAHMR